MTDTERLSLIASLFGGVKNLAEAIEISPSGITRRIKQQTAITSKDWIVINHAIDKRMANLSAARKH